MSGSSVGGHGVERPGRSGPTLPGAGRSVPSRFLGTDRLADPAARCVPFHYGLAMKLLSRALIALVALLHVYIAWFEIFAWTDVGPDVFSSLDPDLFAETVDIAANQGVYNLFLAVGLVWSLLIRDPQWRFRIALCFLGFVAVAGLTAAITLEVSNGLPQLVPSVLAIVVTWLSRSAETSADAPSDAAA